MFKVFAWHPSVSLKDFPEVKWIDHHSGTVEFTNNDELVEFVLKHSKQDANGISKYQIAFSGENIYIDTRMFQQR